MFKIQYLPHHQPSHDKGVVDGDEAINRRWVEATREEKETKSLIKEDWKSDRMLNHAGMDVGQRKTPHTDLKMPCTMQKKLAALNNANNEVILSSIVLTEYSTTHK